MIPLSKIVKWGKFPVLSAMVLAFVGFSMYQIWGRASVLVILILWAIYFYSILLIADRYIPFVRIFTNVPHKIKQGPKNYVALTFDDGPSPEYTIQILDILDRHEIKATFFFLAKHVEMHPAIALEAVRRGHTIGDHTYHHTVLPGMSEAQIKEELVKSADTFQKVLNVKPRLFRFPKGFKSRKALKVVNDRNLVACGFSYPAWDVENPSHERIVSAVLGRVKSGDILLFHDGVVSPEKPHRDQLLKAIPKIIEGIRAKGLILGPLSEEMVSIHNVSKVAA